MEIGTDIRTVQVGMNCGQLQITGGRTRGRARGEASTHGQPLLTRTEE